MTGSPDGAADERRGGTEPGPADEPDALTLAWTRALAAARARGMRPGMPGGALGGRARSAARYRAGQEVTMSGAGKDGRDPVGIADVTGSLVAQAGWSDAVAVGGVMGRSPEVVGEHVATHCVPVGFANGTLTVRAATTAWATQLRLLVPDVRRRLDAVVGEGVVGHIEVLAGRPVVEARPAQRPRPRRPRHLRLTCPGLPRGPGADVREDPLAAGSAPRASATPVAGGPTRAGVSRPTGAPTALYAHPAGAAVRSQIVGRVDLPGCPAT